MITIPKKVEYGLVFISYLSRKEGEKVTLADAAKKLYLPYRFLSSIATGMRKNGIVESFEGKNGGYQLASGWMRKTLFDLVEAVGENKAIVNCGGCGRDGKCFLKGLFGRIETSFINELKSIKLHDIK